MSHAVPDSLPAFLDDGTGMGERIAAFPWETTPLGPLAAWSATLRITVGAVLRSPVAIVTLWGEEGVMIYNQPYALFAGRRHPGLLGRPVREAWPEMADFNDKVMKVGLAGATLSFRDREFLLDRTGRPEPAWLSLDHSPILDEEGRVVGIVAALVETTARVRAERRLSGEHEQLRRMFEEAPGFISMLEGPDHVFALANRACRDLAGGRPLVGLPVREALPEIVGQGFVDLLDQVHASGTAHVGRAVPVRLDRPGGAETRILDFVLQPVQGRDGRVTGLFVQGHDVTEEARAAAALREQQDQLAAFVSQSTAGFGQVDLAGRFTLVNDRFCEIVGRSRDELMALTIADVTHPDDLPRNLILFRRAVAEGTPYTHEKRFVRGDGSIVWVNNSVSVIRRADGEPYGVLAVSIDVTERRRTELAIRENEARLRALTDNLPGGMVFQIASGRQGEDRAFLYVSESFEKLTGIPAREVARDPMLPYRLILPEDVPALAAAEAQAQAGLTPFNHEARFRRADGEVRWSRIISAPREQPDGSLVWDGLQIDISEQKAAEAAIREGKERLDAALEIARLGTVDLDLESGRLSLDERARELLGFVGREAVTVEDLNARILPEDLERVQAEFEAARAAGGRLETEYRIRLEDGAIRTIASLSDALPGAADGLPTRMIGVLGDKSEHKRLEENLRRLNETLEERVRTRTEELEQVHAKLRQSQKLEAMGQLTGGVAHDFNNLLTPIVAGLDLLQRRGIGGDEDQRLIGAALESAERAKLVVQRLLAFARRQPLQPGAVDLAELVGGLADIIASTSGPRIGLVLDMPEALPPALSDAHQLEMAILNLAVNARDAMPEGGTLRISAGREEVGAGHAARLAAGTYVRLAVSDTGTGMDEDTLARAVDPFFSTKGTGKGTGLGLSMVHGLVSQLGGAMLLDSRPGQGTTATLYLPALDGRGTAGESAARAEPAERGEGRVLVVDDEDLVRLGTAAMLRDLGYAVAEAASAREAMDLLRAEGADYLVTDHLMPGMTGTELAAIVAAIFPATRTLIVSGYADLERITPAFPRLAKPFRLPELAAAMKALQVPQREPLLP